MKLAGHDIAHLHRYEASAASAASVAKWMITGTNISKLRSLDPTLTSQVFDNRYTFALGNPVGNQVQVPTTARAIPTLIFRSFAMFQSDLANGEIASEIKAVAYDPEKWKDTPLSEQSDPVAYLRRFAQLAHEHGFVVIEAPARDLMGVRGGTCTAAPGESYDHAYLRCGLASAAARAADILEIQAQADEFNIAAYRNFVVAAAKQATEASPRIGILAGLSTGPASGVASPAQLLAAAQSVSKVVSGYWMNVFASRPGQLESALGFLRSLR